MKNLLGAPLLLTALAWPNCALAGDLASQVNLGPLQVRQFDSAAGDWRRVDLFKEDFFYGWNWRGSDMGGSNDDLEILVPLIGEPGSDVSQPLVVAITSRSSRRVIESRQFTGVELPASGTAYQIIHVRDAACAGALDVVARLGTQEQKLVLGLDCGE